MSTTPINYRAARYVEGGRIDCEIEHPQYGWIPFTAAPGDTSASIDVDDLIKRAKKRGDIAPYAPVVPSVESTLAALTADVQAHLDATAQAFGYDSIYTAVSYADEPAVPKFQAEGRALRAWRSLVWAAAGAIRDAVEAGARQALSAADLIAELPAFSLTTDGGADV